MRTDVTVWQAAASFVLVVVVVGISWWRKLGLERSVLWASARATVQLLAVGALFTVIFESSYANGWSALWIVAMVAISAFTVTRRTGGAPHLAWVALGAIGLTVAVVLGVVFGFSLGAGRDKI